MTQRLVLGYLIPLVSKAAAYLASGLAGTFPLVLRANIRKYDSDAASAGKKEIPPDGSIACAGQLLTAEQSGLLPEDDARYEWSWESHKLSSKHQCQYNDISAFYLLMHLTVKLNFSKT